MITATAGATIRTRIAAALFALLILTGCSATTARRLIGVLSFARIYASDPQLLLGELKSQLAAPFALETVPTRALIDDIAGRRVDGAFVRGVPFYVQTGFGCGPSALASALAYCGGEVDLGEITRATVLPKIGGTLTTDMVTYPRTKGFRSEWLCGRVKDLCWHLSAGRPVICLLGTGLSGFAGHYVIVTACAPGRGVVCHSGRRAGRFMGWRLFDALWSASERWMMVLSRGEDESWSIRADEGDERGRAIALIEGLAAGRVDGACVKGVPFYKQARFGRGPAALASALAHCKAPVDLKEITSSIMVFGGTLFTDMVAYARKQGFWSEMRPGSPEALRAHLSAGRPVICMLGDDLTGLTNYYAIVTACAPGRGIVCHNGRKANHFMDWERFEKLWSGSGRCMIVVCQPADVDWPLPPHERNELGLVWQRRGRIREAIKEYEAALTAATQRREKSRITYNLGHAHVALGRLKQARAAFERAVELDPDFPDAANALAFAHAIFGTKLKKAESLVRGALEAAPERAPTYLDTLGFILHRQGRDAEAVKVLKEAIEKAPADDVEQLAEIYYHLGLASRDPKEREAALRKAAELAPESSSGREAETLLKKGQQKARKSR